MPHIASQICQREPVPQSPSLRRTYECHEFDRPEMYQRRKTSNTSEHQVPCLSLLVSIPNAKHHDFNPVGDMEDLSSPIERCTPDTAVDSVFDLPSAYPMDSPNSSVGSPNTFIESPCSYYRSPNSSTASSIVVELEDTSALAAAKLSNPVISARKRPRLPDFKPVPTEPIAEPNYLDQLKKTEISSFEDSQKVWSKALASFRLSIGEETFKGSMFFLTEKKLSNHLSPEGQVVSTTIASPNYLSKLSFTDKRATAAIENIIAIESDNRMLLERAIAAEEATAILKKKTESLQHRIDYCSNLHRPKTAPEKKPRAASTGAVISSFNKTSLQRIPQTPPLLQTGPLLGIQPLTAPGKPATIGKQRPIPAPLTVPRPYLAPSPKFGSPISDDPFGITYGSPRPPKTTARRGPSPLALSQPLASPPLPKNPAASPFPTINFPVAPHPHRRRPAPLRTCKSYSTLPSTPSYPRAVTTPISATTTRHFTVPISEQMYLEVQPEDAQSRGLERRRQKPLPPVGPISPSAIPGKVEIGCAVSRWELERERAMEEERQKRKGVRGFLKYGWKSKSYQY